MTCSEESRTKYLRWHGIAELSFELAAATHTEYLAKSLLNRFYPFSDALQSRLTLPTDRPGGPYELRSTRFRQPAENADPTRGYRVLHAGA